jgi:hypothetical protein
VPIATIHSMNDWFDHAFRGLAVDVAPAEVQHIGTLVHQCMEGKTRTYHTTFHVVGLCEGMHPIQVLAALLHDVVFYQVDGGIPACVSALLNNVTRPESGFVRLLEIAPEDRAAVLCVDIFGFHPGQRLSPRNGMNEFLSAVVAARLLQAHLSDSQLMAVVACIELTIPFRAPDAKGHTAAQRLARRVQARCNDLAPALLDEGRSIAEFVKTTVTNAVDLANRDVTGFIEASPECCLVSSMLLVEESMMPQAATGERSLLAYRNALLGMDAFLSHLNPACVGQSFEGHPTAAGVMQMQATARQNIGFVRGYLAAVLSAVAIIEALARSAAASDPVALSLFGMPCTDATRFPARATETMVHVGLYQLLKNGLDAQENPGLIALPLAAYVYEFLGQDATQQTVQQARRMFGGALAPRAFLRSLDRDMVCAIIRYAAAMDEPSSEAFLALEHTLYAGHVTD